VCGNLSVRGGPSDDKVELAEFSDLTVGGSAAFRLGDGYNLVVGMNARTFDVGRNLSYVGGPERDTFQLRTNDTAVRVGGDVAFALGDAAPALANTVEFAAAAVGGNLTCTGGAQEDRLRFSGDSVVGGHLTYRPGGGENFLTASDSGAHTVGGNLTVRGGAGRDVVTLDRLTVGRDATLALGDGAGTQAVTVGHNDAGGVRVFGSLKVTGGSAAEHISLRRLYVGNALTVATGAGNDTVELNDVDVAGPTTVSLGTGDDGLGVELTAADATGALAADTTFGGKFTVRGGAGTDVVNLSNDSDSTTFARFGAKVALSGGAGTDILDNINNVFSVTGNFEDFEVGDPVP
jgi:hypothetical protein